MTIESSALARGYAQTDFEMIATGAQNKYELPVSTPACYRLADAVTPNVFTATLDEHGYVCIAPFQEETRLSSKLLDTETNEFLHVKLIGTHLRIYPKSEEFSRETFDRLVTCVQTHLTALTLEVDDAE